MSTFYHNSNSRVVLRLAVSNQNNNELITKYRNAASSRNTENATNKDFNAGFDLFVPEELQFNSLTDYNICIDFGIKAYMIEINNETGQETPLCYWMVPRSSVGSKTPLRMANSVGVIDSGYRGNLKGYFDNMDAYRNFKVGTLENQELPIFNIKSFDRFVQIIGPRMDRFDVEVVDFISVDTNRGEQGFGSSGR
tara:strand:- start:321 stop:905 length:585 start_codon:yes stop_codon:yes gene_type:complete